MRGEKTQVMTNKMTADGSPPLARGKDFDEDYMKDNLRITPACAGKSTAESFTDEQIGDHPRLRGEKAILSAVV